MKKKLSTLTVLVLLLSPFSAFSQDSKTVAVTAEKEVDIKNDDPAAARTIALSLAARDAVEKAYGTFLKVEELKEARTVIANTAANLQYSILEEEQKGNRYRVKIQASVQVPAEYVRMTEDERETFGEGMESFVQKYPQGEINWGEGLVIAHGIGQLTEQGTNSEEKAARAAEIDARARLLEMINDISLDDRRKAGQDERIAFLLEGFVRGSEIVARSKSGSTINLTVQAPIRGVQGLLKTIHGFYTPDPPPPKPEPIRPVAVSEVKSYTGVVIDARKVSITPALFPKITDTKEREVYSVGQVNKEELQKRGMASYALVSRDAKISRLFPNATLLHVSYHPGKVEDSNRELSKRQGQNAFILRAESSEGEIKSSIVLTDEDAARLVSIGEHTNALKDCRVVIVVSP